MKKIDISKMNKAEILAKLYNNSKPQGMGMLHYTPEDMTVDEAQKLLDNGQTYFDYVQGRILKIDLSGNELDPWLYDRDNGQGTAARTLAEIE